MNIKVSWLSRPAIVLLCMIPLFGSLTAPAMAQTDNLNPSAHNSTARVVSTATATQDVYIDSFQPTTNLEGTEELLVGRLLFGAQAQELRSLIQFDLTDIPPGSTIYQAFFQLYQTTASGNPLAVQRSTQEWSSKDVTWATQPDPAVGYSWIPTVTDGYASLDVTKLVDDWVNGRTPNFGFVLSTQASASDARVFHSLENPGRQPPRLQITFDLPPIRVCFDTDKVCPAGQGAVAGAEVIDVNSGKSYTTDTTGLVLDGGAIQPDDELWVRIPVDRSENDVRYLTSGDADQVVAARFGNYADSEGPEMRIVLDRPLLVRDLTASTQWNLEGDPAFKDRLKQVILQGSDAFYDYTDGQFALGTVTIYQGYENWDNANIWFHASNTFRPLSHVKGEVSVETADPMSPTVDLTYAPGHIFMGSHWNRYGFPPSQPVPAGEDVSMDWPRVIGHELGHYLLGEFDSYLAILPSGVVTETYGCTGSAMGWVYDDINTEFVADPVHWNTACKNTLGDYNLKRTEWDTIQAWYPWAIKPAAVDPGPDAPPVPLTQVIFVADPSAPAPLANQTFDLLYQNQETASSEARAFVLRDSVRMLDQGRPAQGSTQVTLTGAQPGDRLCVIDINDHAEAPETPRHQYGCESLETGDNALLMERTPGWAPVIYVNPLTPNTVGISVTQQVAGVPLRARLYPEHSQSPVEIQLAGGGDQWDGVFNVAEMTPAAFIELWLDDGPPAELDPNPIAIIDYGIGGGAVPGPKSKWGFAPVVSSSDGRAVFTLPPGLELLADQFIAIQTMAGTPRLPIGSEAIGQAYRLISLPPELVEQGSMNLYFPNVFAGLAASSANVDVPTSLAVHFWNGAEWQRLDTTIADAPDGRLLATAASQGTGTYALLYEAYNLSNFLPLIAR